MPYGNQMDLRLRKQPYRQPRGAHAIAHQHVRAVGLVPAPPVPAAGAGRLQNGLPQQRYLSAVGVPTQGQVKPSLVPVPVPGIQRLAQNGRGMTM